VNNRREVLELITYTALCYTAITALVHLLKTMNVDPQQAMIAVSYVPTASATAVDLVVKRRVEIWKYVKPLIKKPQLAIPTSLAIPWITWAIALAVATALGVDVRGPLVEPLHEPSKVLDTATFIATTLSASLLNTAVVIGEEVAWRGYMYVKLRRALSKYRETPLETPLHSTVVGAIWSLWHTPMILNYRLNYPTTGATGLLVQTPLMIAVSTVMKVLRDEMGFLPCALVHATYNTLAPYMYLSTPLPDIHSPSTGTLALTAWTATAAITHTVHRAKTRRKQHKPQRENRK